MASSWGSTPSTGDISSFLKNVRKSVKIDEPIENAAHRLVLLCFAAAIDELRPVNTETDILVAARETVKKIKDICSTETFYLDDTFFTNPVSLPLYQSVREVFIEALKPFWHDETSIGGKLDSAFNTSLFKIVRLEKDMFKPLLATLVASGANMSKLEQDWTAYRQRLVHAFEVKPVFGQEESHISLSQIFIPPRAYWSETKRAGLSHLSEKPHVLNLMPDMLEWAKDGKSERCVRLLRGGPGSGKSSFAKAFCAEMAKDENVKPIFIELQRLRGSGSLQERASNLLVDIDELFRIDPLNKEQLDPNRPLILVFDGLDELVAPSSKGAQQVAEDIWDDLDDLPNHLNTSDKVRAKALITGRDPIIQAARSSRRGRRLNSLDAQRIIGLEALNKEFYEIGESVDDADHRPKWWKTYAKAKGLNSETPPILINNSLKSLTSEPLLCYLVALSGKAEESRKQDVVNINDVYEQLINDIWNRVWGDVSGGDEKATEDKKSIARRLGPVGVFNSRDEFEQVLEHVALAAWRSGESRTATLSEFEKSIKHSTVEDIWQDFQNSFDDKTNEDSFGTLALTFFFRQQDLTNRGFEFTHKSFGEYLAARAIYRFLKTSLPRFKSIRSVSNLDDWLKLTGAVPLTREVYSFLKNEFERQDSCILLELRDALTRAMKLVAADGMPIKIGSDETFRNAEVKQANAESALLAVLSATSRALLSRRRDYKPVKFISALGLSQVIARLEVQGLSQLYRGCLSGFDFNNSPNKHSSGLMAGAYEFESLKLVGCDLSFSEFSGVSFGMSILANAKITRTTFAKCSFYRALIIDWDFKSSVSSELKFDGAALNNCYFSGMNLSEFSFERAALDTCMFVNTKFGNSNFERTVFENCDFSGADLSQTKGLKVSQLKKSQGNTKTRLPAGMKRPNHWI